MKAYLALITVWIAIIIFNLITAIKEDNWHSAGGWFSSLGACIIIFIAVYRIIKTKQE